MELLKPIRPAYGPAADALWDCELGNDLLVPVN